MLLREVGRVGKRDKVDRALATVAKPGPGAPVKALRGGVAAFAAETVVLRIFSRC
jgi:hypothetical protein